MRALYLWTIVATLLMAALPASASAGEQRWDGFYAGGFVGYADGRAHATAPYDAATGYYYNIGGEPYALKVDGIMAGGFLGAGWQTDAAVFGIEAELGYMDLGGRVLDPNATAYGFDDTFTTVKSDAYGALYGRLGIDAGGILIYAKAGPAFLHARGTTIDACVAPPASCGTFMLDMAGGKTLVGWSVGGGAEWALGAHWSLRTEYAFFDFGRITTTGFDTGDFPYIQTIGLRAHTFRLGVGYRW